MTNNLKTYLDECVDRYNRPAFIGQDPISIPHQYSRLQDIEITGFWTAMLAWGQRKTIMNKARELFGLFTVPFRRQTRCIFWIFFNGITGITPHWKMRSWQVFNPAMLTLDRPWRVSTACFSPCPMRPDAPASTCPRLLQSPPANG